MAENVLNAITLPKRLPTLVQFIHGITAVHKTDDKVTIDSKKRATYAQVRLVGRKMASNLNCICGIRH